MLLGLSVARLRNFSSMDELDREGEDCGEGSECSCNFSIISTSRDPFWIFTRTNFLTGRTKRDDVRARFLNVYVKVKELVHFMTLSSIRLLSIPKWATPASIVSTSWTEPFFGPSFASSQLLEIAKNPSLVAFISDLSLLKAYEHVASPCALSLIPAWSLEWSKSSGSVNGTSGACAQLNGGPSSSDFKVGFRVTADFFTACRGFTRVL